MFPQQCFLGQEKCALTVGENGANIEKKEVINEAKDDGVDDKEEETEGDDIILALGSSCT